MPIKQKTIKNRTIFCKDNLDILQGINSNSIDLIYLDPPFNKKKVFTAPIGSSAEGASFKDYFREEDVKNEWVQTIKEDHIELHNFLTGIKTISSNKYYLYNYCYLSYMAIRLIEIKRILKDTGSIYLHCDPTMSHYIKLLMDIIFGENNFRNEIVWQRNDKRGKGSQFASKKYGSNTDTILFYTKTDNFKLENTTKSSKEEVFKKFNKTDKKGRKYYVGIPLFCSKSMGARPNLCFTWKGFKNPYPSGWRLSKKRLEEEYQKGNIIITEDGKLERRKYLEDYEGEPIDNNWIDISRVIGKEDTGYPTQKPLALLERIIRASSEEEDVVLDPFCGCATTCIAAEKLNRQWTGIDVSHKAYDLVRERLQKEVANPENLLQYQNEIHYSTTPPKRTDTKGDSGLLRKYIYVISNKSYPNDYKVGIASDVDKRLNSYQTSDPKRGYKLEFKLLTDKFRDVEKSIHKDSSFEVRHEWVKGNLKNIIKAIKQYDKELHNGDNI